MTGILLQWCRRFFSNFPISGVGIQWCVLLFRQCSPDKMGANVEIWRVNELEAVLINLSPISRPESRPEPRTVIDELCSLALGVTGSE